MLISDYLRLAAILDLPEKDDPDTQRVIDGVKQWLNDHGLAPGGRQCR